MRAVLSFFPAGRGGGGSLRRRLLVLAAALLAAGLAEARPVAATAPRQPAALSSSSVEVQAKVQRGTVGRGEDVVYVLTVEGASLAEIEFPEAPSASGLVPESRQPQISQDVVYRNGQLQRTLAFRWTYRPQRTGQLQFMPVTFTAAGERYRTETVSVRVLRQPPPASSGKDDAHSAASSDNIFIEAALSDSTIYRGEQTTVTYRLFYRQGLQLRQSRLAGSWDAPGFWREELDVPSRPDVGTTRRDGEAYKSLLLKRVALFPTRTGRLTLSPLEIETRARQSGRSQGLLGRLFSSGRSREISVVSDSVHLRARPLPGGAPASFRGAVGRFRMDRSRASASREVRVGDAVELRLEISGYGNLATVEAPPLDDVPDGLETYPPDSRLDIDREGRRVRGSKTFTYTLVPRERGTYRIPSLAFSYFAPEAERYRTLRTDAVTIRATGSARELAASSGNALPPGDLAGPLTERPAWTRPGRSPLYRRVWPYAALGGSALLAAGLLAWRRRRAREDGRPPEAHPTAQKRLREARHHLDENRPRAFYEETERALRAFVGQRLEMPATGQTRHQLRDGFARTGVAGATQDQFFALLDECERARFAPTPPNREATATASDRAHRLVADLDEALPTASADEDEPAPA